MAIKLYGNPYSTSTRRVAAVFNEKNVPYELVPIDVPKGEHKLEGYVARQPFGQVPYIDDDGFVLYESRAIAWYIAAKYRDQGTPLLPDPADIKATALFKQAVSVEESNFEPYANGITTEVVFKPMRGAVTDQKLVDEWSKTLDAKLDAYEVIRLAHQFITLADLFHLPYGQGITGAGFKHLVDPKRPNLVRWWNEISARPAWVAVKETA